MHCVVEIHQLQFSSVVRVAVDSGHTERHSRALRVAG